MDIQTASYKHCDIVKANGRIDSISAPQLADAMKSITSSRRYKIVFDMAGVDYMSSAGLRVLITTQKTCRRYNRGEIILCNVHQRICEALELAGFLPLFKIFDDSTTAVGHF